MPTPRQDDTVLDPEPPELSHSKDSVTQPAPTLEAGTADRTGRLGGATPSKLVKRNASALGPSAAVHVTARSCVMHEAGTEEEVVQLEDDVQQQPISNFPLRLLSIIIMGALVIFSTLLVAHDVFPPVRRLPVATYDALFCMQALIARRNTPVIRSWMRAHCLDAFSSAAPAGPLIPQGTPALSLALHLAAEGSGWELGKPFAACHSEGHADCADCRPASNSTEPAPQLSAIALADGFQRILGQPTNPLRLLASMEGFSADTGPLAWSGRELLYQTDAPDPLGAQQACWWALDLTQPAGAEPRRLSMPGALAASNWGPQQLILALPTTGAGGGACTMLATVGVAGGSSRPVMACGASQGATALAVDHEDGLWFAVPGRPRAAGSQARSSRVWRYSAVSGTATVAATGLAELGGMALSPQGDTLYLAEQTGQEESTLWAFDVAVRHGTPVLVNRRAFAVMDAAVTAGLQVDVRGSVYATSTKGVAVYDQGGGALGVLCLGRVGQLALAGEVLLLRQHRRILALQLAVRGPVLPSLLL